jgi:hypothetical protein
VLTPRSVPHQDTQGDPKRASNQQQRVQCRRGHTGLDPHHGDSVEVGPFAEALLRQPDVLASLPDLDSDRPAAREHLLGDRIGRHLINALGAKIKSL